MRRAIVVWLMPSTSAAVTYRARPADRQENQQVIGAE